MKKLTVALISIVLVVGFGGMVYYGIRHARGIPTTIEKVERVTLETPLIEKDIDLSQGISLDIWDSINAKEVKLMYQVMVLPWPKVVTPEVTVKAFHTIGHIYFYMSWKDETQDETFEMNKFSDACAVLFPLGKDVQPPTLMMGFLGKANIWQWKAAQDREYWLKESVKTTAYSDFYYPFEEKELLPVSKPEVKSAVNDLIAIRVGTVTPKETQNVEGRGVFKEGTWHVVFKRGIKAIDDEQDASFGIGEKKLIAFAVWNGSKGDRGGRKSISDWVELVIK